MRNEFFSVRPRIIFSNTLLASFFVADERHLSIGNQVRAMCVWLAACDVCDGVGLFSSTFIH